MHAIFLIILWHITIGKAVTADRGGYKMYTYVLAIFLAGINMHPFTTRSRADRKNTPFDCGNDKKDMVANSVRKDL